MSTDNSHNNFYSFLSQLGASFIEQDGSNKRVRSQNFNFGVLVEKCQFNGNNLIINYSFSNSFGNQGNFQQEIKETISPDFFHKHDYFEMMYVLEGTVNVQIESTLYQYQKNDACLINQSVNHLEQFDCDSTVVYLCISKDFAHALVSDLAKYNLQQELHTFFSENIEQDNKKYRKDFIEFRLACKKQNISERLLSADLVRQLIFEMTEQKPGYLYMAHALFIRIFYSLADSKRYQLFAYHLDFSLSDHIFEETRSYIIQKKGQVMRNELEEQLHYHPDYLNKIIKQHTGMTLVEFTQSYRMKEAARLICNSTMSIAKISQSLGFENKAYFYRLFEKTYHMTPIAYRKSREKQDFSS